MPNCNQNLLLINIFVTLALRMRVIFSKLTKYIPNQYIKLLSLYIGLNLWSFSPSLFLLFGYSNVNRTTFVEIIEY